MGKRTMMITQDISELPFDLRSYRATEYTENFTSAVELREAIASVASGVRDGTAEFGNPIQDFAPDSLAASTQVAQTPNPSRRETAQKKEKGGLSAEGGDDSDPATASESLNEHPPVAAPNLDDEEHLGFLDHAIALTESSEKIASIATSLTDATKAIGSKIESRTAQINSASHNLGVKAAPVLRSLMREIAGDFDEYSSDMEELNPALRDALKELADSTNGVSRTRLMNDEQARTQVKAEIASLTQAETTFGEAHDGVRGFADAITNMPDMEKNLTQSGRRAYRAVAEAADIIDLGRSEFHRARLLLEERLSESASEGLPEQN
ncbi:hypothetical protein ABUV78_02810 [Clavibacter nebraskensis]